MSSDKVGFINTCPVCETLGGDTNAHLRRHVRELQALFQRRGWRFP